jgi:AraC-like DNA-binding protein
MRHSADQVIVLNTSSHIHSHAWCETLEVSLRSRTLDLARRSPAGKHYLLLIESGEAIVTIADQRHVVQAPVICSIAGESVARVQVLAGASVRLIACSGEMLVDSIGDLAESFALRILTGRSIFSGMDNEVFRQIKQLFSGIARELTHGQSSWIATCAYLRLLLVELSRITGLTEQTRGGEVTSVLQRFRNLVEIHFRVHRPINDYAMQLGITQDRLHAICTRELQRTPLALLHERVLHEAKQRLERSSNTIQQISAGLGFRDATYFSHFFKRKTGFSPAQYRQQVLHNGAVGAAAQSYEFSDWP